METYLPWIALAIIAVALIIGLLAYLKPKAQVVVDKALDTTGVDAFQIELKRISDYDAQIMALQVARAAAVTRFKSAQASVAGLTVT